MTVRSLTLSALAAAMMLSACGGNVATTSAPATGSNAVTSPAKVAASAAAPSQSDNSAGGTHKFGETVKYPDGTSVTIGQPKPFKPSDTAMADKAAGYVVLDVTVVNGSKKPIEPMMIHLSGQSGDSEAKFVADIEQGVGDTPSTKLLPGRQAKWKQAFTINKPNDLVIELSNMTDFNNESVMYSY